ncbi:hypothetical protein A2574_01745 [Candidatus Shapirobacteria bacterium RIFOXYD1_FULL_38_32]|uniref:Uncharacterized protein n=3 Tax=Candidatus Shapironibacteriota TaxID=1752721 RepID=A0A0G0K8A5_9BACT|nr:MAG: hypothetical protein US90_C0001G0005 [Candidatus Shapirobacteria bacterium GW2011_GWE2_38_30]KKQ89801.1 MAG: hypothetical protein UT14_C0051G0013 [Candidatus Shapirobacteria bacterium GW2011_GWE1_38_92]OGL55833.1 MAG: hypothetical protein A2195_01265 [Candidatus Shapirobacteria bacterium RIFOXYA1_FULL_39_17]OGL56100.1 MAG: hypothetical protein A2367_02740 [Candidatus Shapirobacteria bacterium RIFOXYB1_FULL_38_38]OGL57076.1 MAG: hypothetical protein A2410_00395 [Candidatus Shapirobacteri
MVETHPFGNFVPDNCKYLFLGTFTGKITDPSYDWFFGTKRNQFWPMLESVFGVDLKTKINKQELFSKLQMAIADIILQCERSENSNADNNLINIVYNTNAIGKIIEKNKINAIFFSSRMAEKLFKRNFKELTSKYPEINLVTLPSPSPRYATITKLEKIIRYKELLPKLS